MTTTTSDRIEHRMTEARLAGDLDAVAKIALDTFAEDWDEELTEEQMEYLTGEGGQRYVEKALESGLDGWDMCIREGIIGALEEFNKEEATV